jgi:hypothetical protein
MKKITALLFIPVLFFSCSSDEVKSSENYIETFSLPPEINQVQINIINEQNLVHVLTNSDDYEMLSTIKPTVKPSKDASIIEKGSDWTDKNFKYVVIAENGETREYSVVISKTVPNLNNFEDWTSDKGYYVLSDLNWTSGNAGISTALQFFGKDNKKPENYPTKKTTEGYNGNGVLMETITGGSILGRSMPMLSGNFFLGNFNTSKMIADELAATEFGKIVFNKAKSIKGQYIYKEGDGEFITPNTSKKNSNDSCDIYAAFYQASDDNGNEIILTAKDTKDRLDNSPYVLAHARWQDCSTTQGTDFHPFVLNLNNYKNDPDFKRYNYKLLITFAASKGGATYEGKIGSKLIVDEVEIENY